MLVSVCFTFICQSRVHGTLWVELLRVSSKQCFLPTFPEIPNLWYEQTNRFVCWQFLQSFSSPRVTTSFLAVFLINPLLTWPVSLGGRICLGLQFFLTPSSFWRWIKQWRPNLGLFVHNLNLNFFTTLLLICQPCSSVYKCIFSHKCYFLWLLSAWQERIHNFFFTVYF